MQKWQKPLLLLAAAWGTQAFGAGFLLWDQNGAGVGDYHAGFAVDAADASTAYYNPAGLTYLKHMQGVVGLVGATSNVAYTGDIQVSTINAPPAAPQSVNAVQGGTGNLIPDLYFAQPLTKDLTWAFAIDAPFGMNTSYSPYTYVRYAGTQTMIQTADLSPSVGYKLTDKFSVGGGVDAVYIESTFKQYAGFATLTSLDTLSDNHLNSWGYGYHLGALYQVTPRARVGLSYHSKVDENMSGRSRFIGYLANSGGFTGDDIYGTQISNDLKSSLTLPPYTTLSGLYQFTEKLTGLASVTFTQWSYIRALELQNLAIANSETGISTNQGIAYITQSFRNTWNVSVGTEYALTSKAKIRAGIGYDETPVKNASLRYIPTPDADRYALAVGGQYKPTKQATVDIGWTHLFIANAPIHSSSTVGVDPNEPNPNGQTVTADGEVKSFADIFGFQLTYDFA